MPGEGAAILRGGLCIKKNGGSEGELNRRLGAQKSPSIGSLASHVFSVDADGDIARQLHTLAILRGGLCTSGSDSLNIVGNVCFRPKKTFSRCLYNQWLNDELLSKLVFSQMNQAAT